MERSTWTDERLDDTMQGIDRSFERIGDEIAALRIEMREDMRGLREEMAGMRGDLARVQDRMIQIGFGLTFAFFAALITAILALV